MRLLLLVPTLIFIGCQGQYHELSGNWTLVGASCEATSKINISKSPEGFVTLESECTILSEDTGTSLIILQSDCNNFTNGQIINYTVYSMLHLSYKINDEVCSVTYSK